MNINSKDNKCFAEILGSCLIVIESLIFVFMMTRTLAP